MSLTPSNMLPLNTKVPDFELPDVISGEDKSLSELASDKATVIVFMCVHCPYVKHIQDKLAETAEKYQDKGISFIAINSNDIENYPEDSPDNMKKQAQKYDFTFPYLFDETQQVAKAYKAACTPDFFVFDNNMKLAYRGQFDGSRPGNDEPVTGKDLTDALDKILAGEKIPEENQKPSMGCNIKWKEAV